MSEKSARLESSIREHLAPYLREDGFAGSGRTFRRTVGEFIQVINVQGSQHGGQFAINLGLQPRSIPDVQGDDPDPSKITEELCEFRRRLHEGTGDKWWKHEATKESMDAAVQLAAALYVSVGRDLLLRVAAPESPLLHVTAQQLDADQFDFLGFGSTKVRMALALGRLRRMQGEMSSAREFAIVGLKNIGRASSLKRALDALCA
jgi:hypothetical protein